MGKVFIGFCYVLTVLFLIIGIYKLWVYVPATTVGEYTISSGVNAVVGGDAFNLIINSCKAVAYFILSLIFLVFALGNEILYKLKTK